MNLQEIMEFEKEVRNVNNIQLRKTANVLKLREYLSVVLTSLDNAPIARQNQTWITQTKKFQQKVQELPVSQLRKTDNALRLRYCLRVALDILLSSLA